MSQIQEEAPIEQPQVEVEKIENGHAFLKVLGISNVKNLNNWQIPYNDVSELPQKFLDSFIGKPYVDSHANVILHELHEKLVSEGKSNEEINKEMHQKSLDLKIGTITDRFDPKPDDRINVFYMVEIEDETENKFIKENGRPSKGYSSPGVNGTVDKYENGDRIYHIDDVMGFHITAAENPAYGKFLANVRGVCHKGMRSECKQELGFASIINPSSVIGESINIKDNITTNMSDINGTSTGVPESKISELDTNQGSKPAGDLDKNTKDLGKPLNEHLKLATDFEALRINNEKLTKDYNDLKASSDATNKLLFNTLIEGSVSAAAFDNDEEKVKKERENAYNFITKYKMSFDDAKDYLNRVYGREIIKPKEADVKNKKTDKEMKKETEKSDQYGETFDKDPYLSSGKSESGSSGSSDTMIDYTSELSEYNI